VCQPLPNMVVTETDRLAEVLELARNRRRLPAPKIRRTLRERAGIPQTSMAYALNVEASTISRWESGAREPRGQYLARYLDALERLAHEAL
jgi:DNA-binding transcriptional regulator YiaG